MPVNCSAIPRELIESELFGHKRGAFTGASATTLGLVRSADGGTLFLDEIAEMPAETQAKLLRVIQERTVRPVGDVGELKVDVRFIAATNRNVDEAVAEGILRQDLFYRLAVIRIDIPPLRARPDDIPFLTQHFIEKFGRLFPNRITGLEPRPSRRSSTTAGPGNVRQLENMIESIFAMGVEGTMTLDDLPEAIRTEEAHVDLDEGDLPAALSEAERQAIERALRAMRRQQVAGRLAAAHLPHPPLPQDPRVQPDGVPGLGCRARSDRHWRHRPLRSWGRVFLDHRIR